MTLKRWFNLNEIPVFRKYLNIIIVQFRSQQDYTVIKHYKNTKRKNSRRNKQTKEKGEIGDRIDLRLAIASSLNDILFLNIILYIYIFPIYLC